MRKVTILRGVPGSGKSTIAREMNVPTVSADHYMVDADGNYNFDPARLQYAHRECLSEYMRHMLEWGTPHVIVDNTNITAVECAPYVAIAQAIGADVEVLTIDCGNMDAMHARNTHGVSRQVVANMAARLTVENGRLPRWWNVRFQIAKFLEVSNG